MKDLIPAFVSKSKHIQARHFQDLAETAFVFQNLRPLHIKEVGYAGVAWPRRRNSFQRFPDLFEFLERMVCVECEPEEKDQDH
jgi:hypothetical protein